MRKGLWAVVTAIAAGAVITTPIRAATSPTATTAPPPPRAGTYDGRTSQGLRFSLRVANSRKMLSTAKFGFRLHCANHHRLLFTVSPIVAEDPWRLNVGKGTGFTRTFRDTTGERYTVTGHFGGSGVAAGTLSTTWHSPADGLCTSGRLGWHARLAR